MKYQPAFQGTDYGEGVAPPLGPSVPPKLVMALYRLDYNGDGRKAPSQNVWDAQGASLLVDQPMNGAGSWFSGLRPLWHRQQLTDMRRAGIEVALLQVRADDPLLGRELGALVEALKEMKAAGQDYPLVAADTLHDAFSAEALSRIPTEFRYRPDGADGDWLATANNANLLVTVSPGRAGGSNITSRSDGKTYAAAWQQATDPKTQYVVVDSWNDFSNGTDIAASRQYGERYADDTRVATIAFNGNRQWHTKYLKASVPATILPKTLYQIPVRIENAGTLPWRAGEGYSLCARWYTADGRLADDSAPRIPIGRDVLPGQSVTQSFGLVARNSYGDNLDPGDYILVIDMVQGQNKWFSYAGDSPLQVPVHVVAADDTTVKPQATFLGTTTPTSGQAGGDYRPEVDVRNDGPAAWTGGKFTLAYKIQNVPVDGGDVVTVAQGKGEALSPVSILPGGVIPVVPHLHLSVPPGEYRLHWFIQDGDGKPLPGSYDENLTVTTADPGASFVLSDIPRQMDAGQNTTVKLAVQNLSGETWTKGSQRVGYYWYYLDGTEAQWNSGVLSPFTKDVPPGRADGDIVARVHAPDQPGRYSLVWDVQRADGTWDSLSPASKGDDLLQALITVTGKNAGAVPVDLGKEYDGSASDFDGQGDGLPNAMLPPDGTAEVDSTNPLALANDLGNTPGPPLYPDGYYAGHADHALPFLYASSNRPSNLVVCRGQTINLPGGNYKAIHLLTAATGGQTVNAAFGVGEGSQTLAIADWTATLPAGAAPGLHSAYITGKNGDTSTPVTLGDYVLKLDPSQRVDRLTLPNAPRRQNPGNYAGKISIMANSRRRFPGLSSVAFEHPTDRTALAALRKAPGLDWIFRKFNEYGGDRAGRLYCLSDTVRIDSRQCPDLYKLLTESCEILDMPVPLLFVDQRPFANAHTFGVETPCIVVFSGLLDLLDEEEWRVVLGHELGHIKAGHVLYRQIAEFLARLLLSLGGRILGMGRTLSFGLFYAFFHWYRQSELTADRAGLLASQDLAAVIATEMKLAGGSRKLFAQMDREAFLPRDGTTRRWAARTRCSSF